ncbi:MAG TPA: tetratricopeptide repeat protein [Ohtaekwangia sp.]|nr:tetratricopeptide repeat protein [Ohtaekwangia sp.]
MINKFWLLIIALMPFPLPAQELKLDSLNQALEGHPQPDTIRLAILNEIAYAYYTVEPDKGIAFATEAIALAQQLDRPAQLASAYNHKGSNHWAKGEDSLALAACEEALKIHRRHGNKLGVAKALNNLALNYYNLSDFKKALEYHDEALSIFTALNYTPGIIHSYSNTGVVYLSLSDYPKALENFLHGARFAAGDSLLLANILLNVGLVHKNMHAYDRSLEYAEKARALFVASGQKQGAANALGNLGTLYSETGRYREALRHYQAALQLNTAIGNNRRKASDLVNMAVVYQHLNKYDSAHDYLRESLALYEQTHDKENTSATMVKLAEIYLAVPSLLDHLSGASAEKKLVGYLQQALTLATASGSLQSQRIAWESLRKTFEKYGRHAKALYAYKQQVAFTDSIYNSEKDKELARHQIQFEFEKKEASLKSEHEKDMAVAQAEIERQKTVETAILAGGLLLVVAGVTGYILYRKRKEAEAKRKEAEFSALIADTEMKALRAQMNPHFIFNSLNAISNFIAANKPEHADDYLTRFSRIIRMILENSEYREITLAEDLEALELYLQLEAMRLQNRFSYEIRVNDSLDPENTVVPPLMLQPFVENSIWHGISKVDGGKIIIAINPQDDKLVCVIEDNGPGRKNGFTKTTRPEPKKSLGIGITQSRIDILNEQGRSGATLAFADLPQGLRVTVTLPLLQKF